MAAPEELAAALFLVIEKRSLLDLKGGPSDEAGSAPNDNVTAGPLSLLGDIICVPIWNFLFELPPYGLLTTSALANVMVDSGSKSFVMVVKATLVLVLSVSITASSSSGRLAYTVGPLTIVAWLSEAIEE